MPTEYSDADRAFMRRALALAERGLNTACPNPRVGCVLVKDGAPIGEGFHARAGEAHAEVNALADARAKGRDPRGATAYVTLEPCNHTGRTPPCTEALIDAGDRARRRRDGRSQSGRGPRGSAAARSRHQPSSSGCSSTTRASSMPASFRG